MVRYFRAGFAVFIFAAVSGLVIAPSIMAHHSETYNTVLRVPPVMPPNAQTSGYCCMVYDIDSEGVPQNVSASYCSQEYFAAPSVSALEKWRYGVKNKDGSPVTSTGVTTYMSFYLADWKGDIIRDSNGFP